MSDTKALVERLKHEAARVHLRSTEARPLMRQAADALEALSRPAGEGEWQPIETLEGASRAEIIVLLADGTVRTAARGLGTILLGPFGHPALADNWPTHWHQLPAAMTPRAGGEEE